MSEFHPRVSQGTKNRILKKNNGLCIYCGCRATVIDHVLPMALHKWVNAPIEMLNSDDNLVPACVECNTGKSDDIDINEILKMGTVYRDLHNKLYPYISEYITLKQELLRRHKFKCYRCSGKLGLHSATIRRVNNTKPRTIDNACLLCTNCNSDKRLWRNRNNSKNRGGIL